MLNLTICRVCTTGGRRQECKAYPTASRMAKKQVTDANVSIRPPRTGVSDQCVRVYTSTPTFEVYMHADRACACIGWLQSAANIVEQTEPLTAAALHYSIYSTADPRVRVQGMPWQRDSLDGTDRQRNNHRIQTRSLSNTHSHIRSHPNACTRTLHAHANTNTRTHNLSRTRAWCTYTCAYTYTYTRTNMDPSCFYDFIRNSLEALLEALFDQN